MNSTTASSVASSASARTETRSDAHSDARAERHSNIVVNRRAFLKSGGLAVVAFGLGGTPIFLNRAAAASVEASPSLGLKRRKTLVCIFQRGAMDGLMAVTPYADPNLALLRPRLAMNAANVLDLDGHFGLHPAFQGFEKLFSEKRLAIVHGMGSPSQTRSHFDAQDFMETATPDRKGTGTGWLNRVMSQMQASMIATHPPSATPTPFQAVSMTAALPKSLYGSVPAIAVTNLADFGVKAGKASILAPTSTNAASSFEALYDHTSQSILRGTSKESFDAAKMLSKANLASYKPAAGVNYPASPLGESLRQIAQLVKADVGLEVAFAESGGWDTHVQQGTAAGTFAQRARDLAQAMTAFWADIEPFQDDVTVMTMTEFGRTARENGSGGTDHGRASCLFVLGNNTDGGKVHGTVPVLVPENLADGRDVPVTTDFRAIFASAAASQLGVQNNAVIFPEWTGTALPLFKG
jgi:uncharacterized protein (DUF1501 family)